MKIRFVFDTGRIGQTDFRILKLENFRPSWSHSDIHRIIPVHFPWRCFSSLVLAFHFLMLDAVLVPGAFDPQKEYDEKSYNDLPRGNSLEGVKIRLEGAHIVTSAAQ